LIGYLFFTFWIGGGVVLVHVLF